ncbi:sulfatase-like hydrolase/transferase, partial [bacterium]|nr:sulfatase-like hydrolase/transferase [bacterium]
MSTPNKPINLLFLMTDQHHHGVLGCTGNPLVKTPNLDRLAAQGARFTHATCPVPFCSPTRAAIVTGRYPSTLGLWRNIQGRDDPLRLREPLRTYLHQLAARGYRCHQLGKWHLGHVRELSCFAEGRQDVDAPQQMLVQRRQAAGRDKLDPGPRANEVLVGNVFMTKAMAARHRVWRDEKRRSKQDLSIIGRSQMKPEFHYESVLADYCIQLLRRHRDEPFAINYSVSPPHALWVAPARFYDLYDPAAFTLPKSW